MEAWTCNEGFRQYLMLKNQKLDFDSFNMKMLMHYEGEWLLPCNIRHQNGLASICYETSGGISLQQNYSNQELDKKQLLLLYTSMWKCYEELGEYLLEPEGMLLSPDTIYYLPAKQKYAFCYFPEYNHSFREELILLTEFCMKHTCHQDEEAVSFIYDMYHMLQKNSLEEKEIKQYISEFQEKKKEENFLKKVNKSDEPVPVIEKSPSLESQVLMQGEKKERSQIQYYIYGGLSVIAAFIDVIFVGRFLMFSHRESDLKLCIILSIVVGLLVYSAIRSRRDYQLYKEYVLQRKRNLKEESKITSEVETGCVNERKESTNQPEIMWNSVAMQKMDSMQKLDTRQAPEDAGETVVLETPVHIDTALWELEEQQGTKAHIQLNRLPGILGRKISEVDYMITGEGVSRRHVLLFLSGENLYAEDLASTNGTYVNGVRLRAGEPMIVEDGDLLAIGPCEYRVKKKAG